jgi:hypothetical protein
MVAGDDAAAQMRSKAAAALLVAAAVVVVAVAVVLSLSLPEQRAHWRRASHGETAAGAAMLAARHLRLRVCSGYDHRHPLGRHRRRPFRYSWSWWQRRRVLFAAPTPAVAVLAGRVAAPRRVSESMMAAVAVVEAVVMSAEARRGLPAPASWLLWAQLLPGAPAELLAWD